MKDLNPEFSYIIDTARLPAKGENVEISANDAQKKLWQNGWDWKKSILSKSTRWCAL